MSGIDPNARGSIPGTLGMDQSGEFANSSGDFMTYGKHKRIQKIENHSTVTVSIDLENRTISFAVDAHPPIVAYRYSLHPLSEMHVYCDTNSTATFVE